VPKQGCAAGLSSSRPAIPYVVTRDSGESSPLGVAVSMGRKKFQEGCLVRAASGSRYSLLS
jgi:hypothetical protein